MTLAWFKGPCEGAFEEGPPDPCEVGDEYLVLILAKARLDSTYRYHPAIMTAEEDGFRSESGDSWWDVSYWIKMDKHTLPPVPKK